MSNILHKKDAPPVAAPKAVIEQKFACVCGAEKVVRLRLPVGERQMIAPPKGWEEVNAVYQHKEFGGLGQFTMWCCSRACAERVAGGEGAQGRFLLAFAAVSSGLVDPPAPAESTVPPTAGT